MKPVDFWFSIGSTYTCLTVLRLAEIARRENVVFRWRPFDVRRIMVAQNNIPFRDKPVKAAYMWRDIERRAQRYGLELKLPAPYPLRELTFANQVAMLGAEEGWCPEYVTEAYRLWFSGGLPPGEEPALSRALAAIGQDPGRVVERARSDDILKRLNAETDTAESLGVFGAPTFIVDGELFWGDDRLVDAIAWAREGRLG